jgi:hypothetical protein
LPRSRWQKLRWTLRNYYWQIIRRINVKAYLRHEIDNDPDGYDWESRQSLVDIEYSEYLKRANRLHVSLSDVPLPETSSSHWKQDDEGERHLSDTTLKHFKQLVENAEYDRDKRRREGKEHCIKWITVIAAIIAALASLYVALFKK